VVGVADEDLGQRIHAVLECPDGFDPESLSAHLAARLVHYKRPGSFEVVDRPIRNDAGKVRRAALRPDPPRPQTPS
jgi:bile acid-coenzyme A ligase